MRIHEGAYPNLALSPELSGLSENDRRFVTSLVYTVTDNLGAIDALLGARVSKPVRPKVRCVLRMGVCQMVFMNVPESAACDESVKLVKAIGKAGLAPFVNGVLRSVAREEPRRESQNSAPEWLEAMWESEYGAETARALINRKPDDFIVIRDNALRIDKAGFHAAALKRGWASEPGGLGPGAYKLKNAAGITEDELFKSGKIAIQGEASQWACRVLDAREGYRVLDACAAPGGKTACIAAQMRNVGEIVAWDKHAHRVRLVEKTMERLGVTCVTARARDSMEFLPEYERAFDAVLVDAPCSGLGVCKPGLWQSKRPEDIEALSALQTRLLNVCSRYVKSGGALVYATCTVSRRENDLVADRFDAEHGDFTPSALGRFLPNNPDCGGRVQLLPHVHGTDGFFVAKWLRV